MPILNFTPALEIGWSVGTKSGSGYATYVTFKFDFLPVLFNGDPSFASGKVGSGLRAPRLLRKVIGSGFLRPRKEAKQRTEAFSLLFLELLFSDHFPPLTSPAIAREQYFPPTNCRLWARHTRCVAKAMTLGPAL